MAKQTFMSRVKAYRKLHPRTSQVEAMQKLAGKKVKKSPVKTKARKPVARKKSVVRTEKVTVIGSHRRKRRVSSPRLVSTTRVDSLYKNGMAILRKIDGMEAKLKHAKSKSERSLLITLINAEHDKLDKIQKRAKSA